MAYVTVAELRRHLGIDESTTFTATAASDILTLASVPFATKSIKDGTPVEVSTTGTLPTGLAVSTVYYVIMDADQIIKLATSSSRAAGGEYIDITTAGTGVHTITLSDDETDELTDAITQAEAFVEAYTGRDFEGTSATRYYGKGALDPWDGSILHLDGDLYTLTTLKNGDEAATPIALAYYTLLPRNNTPPYHSIQLTSDDAYYWEFDTDCWVSVLGTWGYSTTVPGDVKRACLRTAAYFYKQKDAPFETTAIPEAGVISVPAGIPAGVTQTLGRYRKLL